jgi:hypothetical protein
MKDEALELALEALEDLQRQYSIYPNSFWDWSKGRKAITAIKQALAAQPAPVQEPVWIQPDHLQKAQKAPFLCRVEPHKRDDFVPLHPTPPAQPAVPDAIHHTDLSEHPQYIEGWNDCRAEMLKGMKP